MSRAIRRHHDQRMKVRARKQLAADLSLPSQRRALASQHEIVLPHRTDARVIGAHAAVHGRACSCFGCSRRCYAKPTKLRQRERLADLLEDAA